MTDSVSAGNCKWTTKLRLQTIFLALNNFVLNM